MKIIDTSRHMHSSPESYDGGRCCVRCLRKCPQPTAHGPPKEGLTRSAPGVGTSCFMIFKRPVPLGSTGTYCVWSIYCGLWAAGCGLSYKLFPSLSIATMTGKSFTSKRRIASVPRSSYATSSTATTERAKRAAAPPKAAK